VLYFREQGIIYCIQSSGILEEISSMEKFILHSEYAPTGDQPQAIEKLADGFLEGNQFETLVGVTGSGKTFTMANIIERLQKPTLIISHNKTLAAQLYGEMKEFFPENAVEYFVSYYDYYQPEAYVPQSDTYIAKDSAINDEIDKLRHSATAALSERKDVIIVASVSCIYGLGAPVDYQNMVISLRPGMEKDRDDVIRKLIDIQYIRSDTDFKRGTFRVHGDVLEIYTAASSGDAVRVEFFGDEVDRITQIDSLTGTVKMELEHVAIFPNSHYVVEKEKMERAIENIREEMEERVKFFKSEDKLIEAQRIAERTNFDIEMMQETGFCSGIENYSRHLSGLPAGVPPYTLMDYFPDDFLIIVDESHITIPQVRGMYAGDQSRKTTLVDYGFRLPSAKDNRPLNFTEFENKISQMLFVSATPSVYEREHELLSAEQIIRPTGLLDPEVIVRPIEGQIDDLVSEINKETAKHNKILVTTLTKKMAEDLTDYLKELGIRVKYLHADIDTLERQKIIRDMRLDGFDVLVGINLLREGLDIPEISLVAILDADKEGFLRTETSLVQTIGRAARNSEGHVIMYADKITDSMDKAITETQRRRQIQQEYNDAHGITPQTIKKAVRDLISISRAADAEGFDKNAKVDYESMSVKQLEKVKKEIEKNMHKAAAELNFEEAAVLRDKMIEVNKYIYES
jgi:excinuclease ABC subunit B